MFEGLREARRMNDRASNPLHWANRGWSDSRFSIIPGMVRKGPGTHPRAEFDLPWLCSGLRYRVWMLLRSVISAVRYLSRESHGRQVIGPSPFAGVMDGLFLRT